MSDKTSRALDDVLLRAEDRRTACKTDQVLLMSPVRKLVQQSLIGSAQTNYDMFRVKPVDFSRRVYTERPKRPLTKKQKCHGRISMTQSERCQSRTRARSSPSIKISKPPDSRTFFGTCLPRIGTCRSQKREKQARFKRGA